MVCHDVTVRYIHYVLNSPLLHSLLGGTKFTIDRLFQNPRHGYIDTLFEKKKLFDMRTWGMTFTISTVCFF